MKAFLTTMIITVIASGLVHPHLTQAGNESFQETTQAIEQLRRFSSEQATLTPKSSCSMQQELDDEGSVVDLSEESCSLEPENSSPMRRMEKVLRKLTGLPGTIGRYLGQLVEDYEQVLQIQNYKSANVGQGNFGLASYLVDKFRSDPELLKSAREFYAEIEQADQRNPVKRRPSIRDAVPPAENGWAWKTALKHSGGDPLKAMRIIGLCGHDDVYQLIDEQLDGRPYSDQEKRQEYQSRLQEFGWWIRSLQKEKSDLESGGASNADAVERLIEVKAQLQDYRKRLASLKAGGPKSISMSHPFLCPNRDSRFFLPGSLGVDISDPMKKRVEQLQSAEVAAKYYHVYGAAVVACELVRKGHSPALVAGIQKLLGWAYRAQRFNTEVCALARRAPEDRELEGIGESEQLQMDAAELMRRWALNTDGTFVGKKVLFPFQTNFRVVIPRWMEEAPVVGKVVDRFSRPMGWSDERFRKARAKFETYMTDWQWTTEAHEVGGAFGAKVCAPVR